MIRSVVLLSTFASCGLIPTAAAWAWPDEVRPANFYKLVTSNNAATCPAALKALNKRYVFPTEENPPDIDRIAGRFLLTTDTQVHWHLAVGEARYMHFAEADFQNSGKLQTIYRTSFTLSNQIGESVGTSTFDPRNLQDSNETPASISQKIDQIERASRSASAPNQSTTPQWNTKKDAPSHLGNPLMLFVDVVTLPMGTYMLVTSAFEAQDFYQHYVVLKDYRGKPRGDVYLLQYVKDGDIPMICHFQVRK